ncbi:hypothetical protein HXX76_006804 [Chlamydomonas incerta]|uniref:Uncharacterized protein n=1 Tax=Chlamydomonas incerta TaxID=51695 RepID=A0A835TE14_CHLIN|nr:hypothetical protein HXX76_006804 [Chlamydomonas incerta]|eukprot:KAG2436506.1 hypothetical protein HXX76_006804 [Chlamydomonas incerta]
MGASQSSADGVVTVVAAPGANAGGGSGGPLAELQAHVAHLGEQLRAIKLQGEGPTAWAFASGGVASTVPVIGGSPGPKRAQAGPSTRATATAAATAAVAELQAAAADYRRWYAEREAAAARRQAALHGRMGQVAAEARDTVAALGRVTDANHRTAVMLGSQLQPVAEGVEALAARLEVAAAELRSCRQALRAHRQRQHEELGQTEPQEQARPEVELRRFEGQG